MPFCKLGKLFLFGLPSPAAENICLSAHLPLMAVISLFAKVMTKNKVGSLLFFTCIYCIASEVECQFTCFIHFYFYLFFEICLFNSFFKGIFDNCIAVAEFLYYLIIRILSLGNLKQISSLLTFNQIYR